MSREQEIKEMAITFCTMYDDDGDCGDQGACDLDCWAAREAQRLYNLGYRRVARASWKGGEFDGRYICYCSNCNSGYFGESVERISKAYKYCGHCGAKMDGISEVEQ